MDEHDITKAVIDELTRECSALTAERDAALARAHAIEQEIFRNHPVGPVYVDVFQSIKLQREQTEAAERERDALRELLCRIRQWDQLPHTGDGPFWIRQIDAALKDAD